MGKEVRQMATVGDSSNESRVGWVMDGTRLQHQLNPLNNPGLPVKISYREKELGSGEWSPSRLLHISL